MKDWTNWIAVPGTLAGFGALVATGHGDVLTSYASLCVAGLIFLNLTKFKSFKTPLAEGELREALAQTAASLAEVRTIAAAIGEAALSQLMEGEFMDGMAKRHRLALRSRLVTALQAIGMTQAEVAGVERMWRKGVGVIFHRAVRTSLGAHKDSHTLNLSASPEVQKAAKDFEQLLDFENWAAPSSDEMRSFIQSRQLMNAYVEELLLDYAHFERTAEFRRPDVFEKL